MQYRSVTAKRLQRFCKHCNKILYRKGDINKATGKPQADFYRVRADGKEFCEQCNNSGVLQK